jgi:hypothetical protein
MRILSRIARPAVATVLSAAVLVGCSSDSKKAPTCPPAAVLAPTSTLTTFREGMKADPASALYTVGLANVKTDCEFDSDKGTTDSTLELSFIAKRAAKEDAASYKVPYYVAVTQGTRVLSKHVFWVNFGFSAGATTTEFSDRVASTVINLENGKRPYDYELLAGLQLTHDQLQYNQSIGRYAP